MKPIALPVSAAEQEELRRLAYSHHATDKRRCVERLETSLDQNRALLFQLANILIPCRTVRVRWGTLINLGAFSETHPGELWPLVVKWGAVPSEDIRSGIACCILEHILQCHFEEYFPRAMRTAQEYPRFRLTLGTCAKFGQTEEPANAAALDAFKSRWDKTRQ